MINKDKLRSLSEEDLSREIETIGGMLEFARADMDHAAQIVDDLERFEYELRQERGGRLQKSISTGVTVVENQ